jgi:hypothetical protein
VRTRSGAVIQSGLDARPSAFVTPMQMATDVPYRAIVLNTYVTDEDENRSGVAVECDVLLVRANFRLARVPVKQMNHGLNNAWAPWIPRPSTRVISTGAEVNFTTRSSRGTSQGEAPLYSDLDGDLVVVEFMERDPDRPLITGALSHDQNRRRVIGSVNDTDASLGWKEGDYRQGSPRRNEYFISHAGSELRINGQGDVLISTVGATDDPVDETANASVGQIRFRVKNSKRFTVEMDGADVLEVWKDGSQVKVDLGENADQRIPLGDDQVAALKGAIDAIDAFASALATATPAPPNGALTVASVLAAYQTPGTGLQGKLMQAKTDLDAALSDLARTKKS